MKSWEEFEVGKKYRLIDGSLEAHCLMCAGFSSSGLPIMETDAEWHYAANKFNGGATPEGWEEYHEPREWWGVDIRGAPIFYRNKEYADAEADGMYKVFKVREVLE